MKVVCNAVLMRLQGAIGFTLEYSSRYLSLQGAAVSMLSSPDMYYTGTLTLWDSPTVRVQSMQICGFCIVVWDLCFRLGYLHAWGKEAWAPNLGPHSLLLSSGGV